MNVTIEALKFNELKGGPFDIVRTYEVEEEGLEYVGFVLRDEDEVRAIAYAWNLDNVEQAKTADYVELPVLIGIEEEYENQLIDWLEERYTVAGYDDISEPWFDETKFIYPRYSDVIGSWVWVKEKDADPEQLIDYLTCDVENFGAYRRLLWNAVPNIREQLPEDLLLERFK